MFKFICFFLVLKSCMFLEHLSISLDYSICWYVTVHSILLIFLYLCGIILYISFFVLLLCLFGSFLFSFWQTQLKVYLFFFFNFSKNQLFYLIFSVLFWSLFYLFPLWSSFPSFLLTLDFVVLFLIPLGGRWGCLFVIVSWKRPVSL